MKIEVKRTDFTDKSTISDCFVDGEWVCFILEDKDRQVSNGTIMSWSKDLKIPKETAMPRGTYEVAVTFSDRFQKFLPLIMGVPDFEGIRIHAGNTDSDTEGCLLPGTWKGRDNVSESRKAFNKLFALIQSAVKKEKVFITVS